jgi:WD40-like Beta Propeller Repeat
MDLIRGVTSRLTFDPAPDNLPIWSPDGLRILFPNKRTGVFDLYVKAATGAGQEEVLVKLGTPTGWGTHWSRDGRFILYEIPGAKTRLSLGQRLWRSHCSTARWLRSHEEPYEKVCATWLAVAHFTKHNRAPKEELPELPDCDEC